MGAERVCFVNDIESPDSRVPENMAQPEVCEDGGYYVQLPDSKSDQLHYKNQNSRNLSVSVKFSLVFYASICIALIVCLALIASKVYQHNILSANSVMDKAWIERSDKNPLMSSTTKREDLSAVDAHNSLSSQRTAFHFQPKMNWMNDPNGPMFYKGYYHFFYQYNPDSAVWGNITWAHSVSSDLIHWHDLNLALVPDKWYDAEGVWSGSATILPGDKPVILYTGSSNESVQLQNVAVPEDLSDPFLRNWVKIPQNPILEPPPGIGNKDFRDPTTAWLQSDGLWRIAIGAKEGTDGVALIYKTSNFLKWTLESDFLHKVDGTGMWECVDFYPVSLTGTNGLDTSIVQVNQLMKYILKASLDDNKHDYYAVGTYLPESQTFVPNDPTKDVGLGLRYDYGKLYASKTFYDPVKKRRILWGWVNESDSELDDIKKGWSSVQTIPRTLFLDSHTGSALLQWPIEEVETLRGDKVVKQDIMLDGGALVKVDGALGDQLDIEVTFRYPDAHRLDVLQEHKEYPDVHRLDVLQKHKEYQCSQEGAAHGGVFGPFGLLVLAADNLVEKTAVYFYLSLQPNGKWVIKVCNDQSRSSLANGIDRTVYGTIIDEPENNALSLRVIVDHSVVETFVQQGIACITSRVYPTIAIDKDAHLFLFNNGSESISIQTLEAWQMSSAYA